MKWTELYFMLKIIGFIIGLVVFVGIIIYMLITKKKPF